MREPSELSLDEIEAIEKLSLRALYLAACDFGFDAWEVFRQSDDKPKDIAEDATREMLDRLGGYGVSQRIFGNVDYRKARYVVLPDFSLRQALFVDSKAEKTSANARLQMSQLSMRVKQHRAGKSEDVVGGIEMEATYAGHSYLTTILLAHYHYEASKSSGSKDLPPYYLRTLTLAALPSGKLQSRYNPDVADSIWMVGPDAPSRGEAFRVRLNFQALQAKRRWRVQRLVYDAELRSVRGQWED